jgi:hypothetical protein
MKLTTHLHLVPRTKNEWRCTSSPQYALMAWCSVKAQGQLYLYLLLFIEDKNLDFFVSLYALGLLACSDSELLLTT